MAQDSQHLIWIDLEMTGLNPDSDLIIEIATVVTDKDLNILAQGPVLAVHQSDAALAAMDDWNQKHHGGSGLIDRVKASTIDEEEAERLTIEFLGQWVPENASPICGNSIGQDRRFLYRYMPKLEAYFHYRNIDVSTLKELAARWAPEVKNGFNKESTHQALDDIIESIEELRYYRGTLYQVLAMNQLIAVALGGACGAVVRFLMSTGLYQWLGRGFPYGTLVVNIVGSFLIGLLTEALILQRITFTLEYRAAILVGFIGAFTTFSTFSLETLYLIEQGSLTKAALNIVVSVFGCLLAVWIGLLSGRSLFLYSNGFIHWSGGVIPYALMIVNAIVAFLIGIIATILLQKVALSMEYRAAIMLIMVGTYLTLSGLYLILFLIEHGYSLDSNLNLMLGIFIGNGFFCIFVIWLGLLVGKQI